MRILDIGLHFNFSTLATDDGMSKKKINLKILAYLLQQTNLNHKESLETSIWFVGR